MFAFNHADSNYGLYRPDFDVNDHNTVDAVTSTNKTYAFLLKSNQHTDSASLTSLQRKEPRNDEQGLGQGIGTDARKPE